MSVHARATWECDRCGASAEVPWDDSIDGFARPPGWAELDGRELCAACEASYRAWWKAGRVEPLVQSAAGYAGGAMEPACSECGYHPIAHANGCRWGGA